MVAGDAASYLIPMPISENSSCAKCFSIFQSRELTGGNSSGTIGNYIGW